MQSRLQLILQSHLVNADQGVILNRCLEEEVTSHPWHRLRLSTVINSIPPISGGTITATLGSASIVGVGTAFAAADVGKVLRVGTDDALYIITAVADTTHLTISTTYPLATIAGASYEYFPLVYSLPVANAQRITAIKLTTDLVEVTREEINRKDPARRSTGNPALQWAPYGRTATTDYILFELWPRASAARAYYVEYLAGFVPMCSPADIPPIPSAVLENKALWDCSLGIVSLTGDPRWAQQAEYFRVRYEAELEKALQEDSKQFGMPLQVADYPTTRIPGIGYDLWANHDW